MPARTYALHYAEARNGRGVPECFLSPEAAQDMLDTKQAEWGNPKKMTWLRMKKTKNEIPKTARSLKPGECMDGYVEGNARDVAIIEAWRFTWAA